MGVVYLIHFDRPLHHARHYIGYSSHQGPRPRLLVHRSGRGAKILAALNRAGIDYHVLRVWRGKGRSFERALKNRKEAHVFCPCCNQQLKHLRYRFWKF